MLTPEQERQRKQNILTWSLFGACVLVFGFSLTYAIQKAYSSGEHIGKNTHAAQEAYQEYFGEDLQ